MVDDIAKAQLADLMDSVRSGVREIARVQRERARLTATGHGAGRRVEVTVDADGAVIETRLAPEADELSRQELAAAVTAAAQDAAAQVRRRSRELMAALEPQHARMPKLSEFVPGMPDVQDLVPQPPEPPTTPPRERDSATGRDRAPAFTEVVPWEHGTRARGGADVHDPGW